MRILTINVGSSSIKFAIFESSATAGDDPPARTLRGQIERIGKGDASFRIDNGGATAIVARDATEAGHSLADWLAKQGHIDSLAGVSHRIVHGGPLYWQPTRVTVDVIAGLKSLMPIDPEHLPGEIALIEVLAERHPKLPQVACFDTAFHHDLPAVARTLPIPRSFERAGFRKYGFHGLSFEYLLKELAHVAGVEAARGRVVFAHLGNGASLAAVKDGRPIDTTMSYTPTAGLVMGTRSGDLDPGLLIALMRQNRLTLDVLDDLVNKRSGLLGVSEISSDTRDLLARRASDPRAALAFDVFCYQARKHIAAMAAALGGVETLVFSGGIGEHQPESRAQITADLKFLGIELDESANAANAPVISRPNAAVTVRVIPTDEELTLARAGFDVLAGTTS